MGQAHQQSVHAFEAAEQISVLMDGEMTEHEIEPVLTLAKSASGMETWSAYQLIGDTLRSEDLACAGSTSAFVSRFSGCLQDEPHLLAPAAAARVKARSRFLMRPSWVRRAVPGTAIAAAVAAVSWVVVPQMRGPVGLGTPEAIVAQADQGSVGKPAGIVTVAADSAQMIRDPRLDEYLRAHRVSVATDGIVPAMRNVANGATFSQDNTQE
jgi:sigma-E factor negative regulatory protein RseA